MTQLPLSGLSSLPIDPRFRFLLIDDLDTSLLARFDWKLIVPSIPRFLHSPRPESLVVRAIHSGWTFYPHHLVYWNSLLSDLSKLAPTFDFPTIYASLATIRTQRLIHQNRLRTDVRRSNLRLVSAFRGVVVNEPPTTEVLPAFDHPIQPDHSDDLSAPIIPLNDIFSLKEKP